MPRLAGQRSGRDRGRARLPNPQALAHVPRPDADRRGACEWPAVRRFETVGPRTHARGSGAPEQVGDGERGRLEQVAAVGREGSVCDLMAVSEKEIVLVSRESPEGGADASSLSHLRSGKRIAGEALRHGGEVRFAIYALFGISDLQIDPSTGIVLKMRDDSTGAKTADLFGRDIEKSERRTQRSGLGFERGGGIGDDQKIESVPVGAAGFEQRFNAEIVVDPAVPESEGTEPGASGLWCVRAIVCEPLESSGVDLQGADQSGERG